MNFTETLPRIIEGFNAAGIRYALIGGLAMAIRGVQRATLDADFILLSENLDAADAVLRPLGYDRVFHSENVSHYQAPDKGLGRVDLLHAFRPATLGMLQRAEPLPFTDRLDIPVVLIEDLIGLKIQAATNAPSRHRRDWSDIHMLLEHAGRENMTLDWQLIGDYLGLFDQAEKLPQLQSIHGEAHNS